MNKLGLYLHFPFCKSKCRYCDFYSLSDHSHAIQYAQALKRQIVAFGSMATDRVCDTIYFGGGTPTVFPTELLLEIIDTLKENFSLTAQPEWTIEANPGTVTPEMLCALRTAGVNRISFGVQSSDDRLLALIGRVHRYSDAVEAVHFAKNAGFENISVDLMYALPTQTVDAVLHDLEQVTALPISHISFYGLKIEENTPFGRDPHLILPEEEEQCAMYLRGVELLAQKGFQQYEISNFAQNSLCSQHNLRYWRREEYLGLGVAAHSFFKDVRFFAPRDIASFCALEDFSLQSKFYTKNPLEEYDAAEEALMLSLRTSDGYPLSALPPQSKGYINQLLSAKYASIANQKLCLTPRGMLVSNTIISDLLCML